MGLEGGGHAPLPQKPKPGGRIDKWKREACPY